MRMRALIIPALFTFFIPCTFVQGQSDNGMETQFIKQGNVKPLPVIDWNDDLVMPDDILFTPHGDGRKQIILVEVTLDEKGRSIQRRSISGFNLYLKVLDANIVHHTFPAKLFGKNFLVRLPDPDYMLIQRARSLYGQTCSRSDTTNRLYQLGYYLFDVGPRPEAKKCFSLILDRFPQSIAARFGMGNICLQAKEACAEDYFNSILSTNPDFFEAYEAIAMYRNNVAGWEEYAATIKEELVKFDIPLYNRIDLLGSLTFALDKLGRIEEAVSVDKQWYEMQSELFDIYPEGEKLLGDSPTAERAGKLEEATGDFAAAAASYRLADRFNLNDGFGRDYDIELGLARSLKKIGDLGEANEICDQWRHNLRKLVQPSHRKLQSDEERTEGVEEISGTWEYSCGNPEKGRQMIESATTKFPNSSGAFQALADYYYSIGDIPRAEEAEKTSKRHFANSQNDKLQHINKLLDAECPTHKLENGRCLTIPK